MCPARGGWSRTAGRRAAAAGVGPTPASKVRTAPGSRLVRAIGVYFRFSFGGKGFGGSDCSLGFWISQLALLLPVAGCCFFRRVDAGAGARRGRDGGGEAAGAAGRGRLRLLPPHGRLRLRGALPLQPPARSSRRRGERPLLPPSWFCFFFPTCCSASLQSSVARVVRDALWLH